MSWTTCKSFVPRYRQITMPAPHHSNWGEWHGADVQSKNIKQKFISLSCTALRFSSSGAITVYASLLQNCCKITQTKLTTLPSGIGNANPRSIFQTWVYGLDNHQTWVPGFDYVSPMGSRYTGYSMPVVSGHLSQTRESLAISYAAPLVKWIMKVS